MVIRDLKRDLDTWHVRRYEGMTANRVPLPSNPEQAPMSSDSTPTRRPRHHLMSSAQELGFNPDSVISTSLLEPLASPIFPLHWKLLEDSSSTAQWRDSWNYHIRFQLYRLNRSYLRLTDLTSGQRIRRLQSTNQVVATNRLNCYNYDQLLRLNSYPKPFPHV